MPTPVRCFPTISSGAGSRCRTSPVFFGVAAMQSATGFIIGSFTVVGEAAPGIAYRSVFGFLALMIVISLLLYLPARDVEAA